MALNFPLDPVVDQVFEDYIFDGQAWKSFPTLPGGVPAGTIVQWGGAAVPANWLLCDGQVVSRSTYASLFAAIGTAYGVGDGSTTFKLPDLRGRVPVGKNGGSFGTLGATGGVEDVTLTTAQMPSHTHVQDAHTHTQNSHNHTQDAHSHGGVIITGGLSVPNGSYYGVWGNYGLKNTDNATATNQATTATNQNTTATNQNTGGGGSHTNVQPYQVVNYIIKATAAASAGDSELATRVGVVETNTNSVADRTTALETGKANLSGATFTGDVSTSGKVVGTTPINGGSTGGLAVKAPASGSQTSGFLQFVNNAYNAQWASLEATSASELKLNASYVKTPYQPTFFAWQPESGTYSGNGGSPIFTQTLVNVGSNYNTSNGRFTAPTAGIYEFSAQMLLRSTSTNGEATFFKNGANVIGRNMSYGMPVGSNAHDPMHFTIFLSLAAGDYVDVRVSVVSGGDWYYGGGLGWFAGRLVG